MAVAEPTATVVGNLGAPGRASVDAKGRITPWSGDWSLDWWVGADDRWHLPADEIAVRQQLVDDMPVVETAMRVPSGDVVQRAYAFRHGDDDLLVVAVENRSPVPVALALVVGRGAGPVRGIDVQPDSVVVDGRVALVVPKPPARQATTTRRHADLAGIVRAGAAGSELRPVRSRRGHAAAALVWPLTHRTTLRFVVPLVPSRHVPSLPSELPTAEQVASGWRIQGERGMRLALPDETLQSAVDAARRFLLLAGDDAVTLGRYGYVEEAAAVLAAAADERPADGPLIRALAEHWRLHRDVSLAVAVVPSVAAGAEAIARSRRRAGSDTGAVLWDAAEVLRAAGETDAAADAERVATALGVDSSSGDEHGPDGVLQATRSRLLREHADGVALAVDVPEAWFGQGWEVHDAPTRHGRLSYAIRWHGDRPALLWEFEAHPGTGAVRLTAPGLDPAWSSTDLRGDALLAPVLPPGTPVTLRRG